MTLTASTTTTTMANSLPEVNTTQLHAFAEVCSSVSESLPPTVTTPVVMNSLVSPTKVVTTDLTIPPAHVHKIPTSILPAVQILAMKKEMQQASEKSQSDILESTNIPFHNNEADILKIEDADIQKELNYDAEAMDEEILNSPKELQASIEDVQMRETSQQTIKMQVDSEITTADLLLLCDLFYLPFEHGEKALHLLNEFQWLKLNVHVLVAHKGESESDKSQEESQEWIRKAGAFQNLCQAIGDLTKKIAFCKNRELCYDLYTYVWEVSSVTSLLSAFVQWLGLGKFPLNIQSFTQGSYTYFSKGWNEAFTSGNNEPWVLK